MATPKTVEVVLRPKRQVTIPRAICQQLGIEPGDVLEVTVKDSTMTARPRKTVALEALKEIREVFSRSGVTENQLQAAGRRARREMADERYSGRA